MTQTRSANPVSSSWRLELADERETVALAGDIAAMIGAGDLVTLSGDLGAGKTTFARALIRLIVGDPELETPRPTFTLMQIYDGGPYSIVHADLYRIRSPDELADLGWDEAADDALVLVEWPERAGDVLTADRIDVSFHLDAARGATYRTAIVSGTGSFGPKVARARAIHGLLAETGWAEAKRSFMLGDASSRAYERLDKPNGESAVLMISPPRPDGPPIRYGKSYSAIAHLAEDIRAFLAVDAGLRKRGFSAPRIIGAEAETGVAVLEHLGSEPVVDAEGPIPERYAQAVEVLARLHGMDLPDTLPVPTGGEHRIPSYSLDALGIEVELLTDWYAPHIARAVLSSGVKANFASLWRAALAPVVAAPATWSLRDYHSPNLLWLPEREGVARCGLIDFQDCVMGHPAYDLVSLLQDARVTVPDELELKLLGYYARLRREAEPDFNMAAFASAYAALGAQRATKILGIFARLDKRDRKPAYLAHLPRVTRYLVKGLTHPSLADLSAWHEANLPLNASPAA